MSPVQCRLRVRSGSVAIAISDVLVVPQREGREDLFVLAGANPQAGERDGSPRPLLRVREVGDERGEAGNSGRWRSSSLSSSTTAVDDSTEGAGQKGEDQAPPPTQPEKKARRGVPGGYKSYSPDSLETAYRVYRDSAHLGNTVSIRRLAKVSGIPYATLRDHINGRRGTCQGSARDRKEQRIQQIQSLAPHFKGLF